MKGDAVNSMWMSLLAVLFAWPAVSELSAAWQEHNLTYSFSGAISLKLADIDDDGDMDILGAAWNSGISWWENGGGSFSMHTIDDGFSGAIFVESEDIDSDGDMDLIAVSFADELVCWFENDGSENFTQRVIAVGVDGPWTACPGDIDGDGRVDVASCAYNLNAVTCWENTDSTSTGEGEMTGDITAFEIAPNPSNGSFKIEYSVSENCVVSAGIYDVSGRLARSIIENVSRGAHSISVSELLEGVYLIQLEQGEVASARRISVIR